MISGRLTIDDISLPIGDIGDDSYMRDEELRLSAFKYDRSPKAPSDELVRAFKLSHYSLSTSPTLARSTCVGDKYDLNWVSIDDYKSNWNILSSEDKSLVGSLLSSDLHKNKNRFGLKKLNLESHLLLNIGCDMTNIVNNGRDSVLSNLKGLDGRYSEQCLYNRTVDPKTSV